MGSRYWSHEAVYERILEILDAYWITQKDELKVRVSMDFIKANGETQRKCLQWVNPNYERVSNDDSDLPGIVRVSDMNEEYFKNKEREFWNVDDYKKREDANV